MGSESHPPDQRESSDLTATLGFAATATALCAIAWLAGQLSLLLAGHATTRTPLKRAPQLVWSLTVQHDAEGAWRSTYPQAASVDSSHVLGPGDRPGRHPAHRRHCGCFRVARRARQGIKGGRDLGQASG